MIVNRTNWTTPPAVQSTRKEARRSFVVKAIFFIYLLSLIEGPLRKWFLPGLAGPLTLLRDPFVVILYLHCFSHGLIWLGGMAGLWMGFAFVASILGLIQYLFSGFPIEGWLLGVRSYWLYMPMAFIIAATFRKSDVLRFLILNLWLSIPYSVLVAVQYNAGPGAYVNHGVGGDEHAAVQLTEVIVRPFGLFTFTSPNVQFCAAMASMVVAVYFAFRSERPAWFIFLLMTVATGAMLVLTGSRGIYFQVGIVLVFAITALIYLRSDFRTFGTCLVVAAFVGLSAAILVNVFPDMFVAMEDRFTVARQHEGSIWLRAFSAISSVNVGMANAPVLGQGIGVGASGVAQFLGLNALALGESELERNLNELGLLFGSLFICLRILTTAWLAQLALRLGRRGYLMALPLTGFTLVPIAVGQMTHSVLYSFLPWICIGFVIALDRSSKE